MVEANRVKLGLFVLTGLILLVVLLVLLGLAEIFQPKIRYMTYFDESVQGLEIGAPVKYRGATIGKVNRITIRFKDNIIRVDMEGLLSSIELSEDKHEEMVSLGEDRNQARYRFFREWLELETRRGLRCRLELAGITGLKYVELDYFDPADPVRIPAPAYDDVIYLPSAPSLLSGLRTSVSESLSRIAAVDFKRISDEIIVTLTAISSRLNDPKMERLITRIDNAGGHIEAVAANLSATVTEERIVEVADELRAALREYRELAEGLRQELAAAKFADTVATARGVAEQADVAMHETVTAARSVTAMREQLARTLVRFDEALDALTELVRSLDQDPGALLRGKQQPELTPTR